MSESTKNSSTENNQRDKVVHNYVDRSQEPDPSPSTNDDGGKGSVTAVGGLDHNFPMKLHYILEQGGQANVISWQPHGRCFMVHDMKAFVSESLPLWFRQSKFASFQRQLNLYGFSRITQGRDKNSYYHEYFLRGRPLLAQKISRTKVKGKGARKASSPESEPRFYEMPWMECNQAQPAATVAAAVPPAPAVAAPPVAVAAAAAPTIDPTLVALAAGAPAVSVPAAPALAANPGLLATTTPSLALPAPAATTSLGDALSFLNYTQALSAAQMVANPAAAQGETLLLPAFTPQPPQESANNPNGSAMLNSLLASIGGGAAAAAPPAASNFVPIAPAPPRTTTAVVDAGHYKLVEPANSGSVGATNTETVYGTVLAALKAQHQIGAAAHHHHQDHGPSVFTRPGPAPF